MQAPRRKHAEVLRERLPMAGKRILDIGCGKGDLLRFMAREGACAVGLEASRSQAARAYAEQKEAGGGPLPLVLGLGEYLPFADGSFDAAVFFNSLHHIPETAMHDALAQAARVTRHGGCLYIQEPVAAGAYFEMMRPVEDETYVRARAYEALCTAGETADLILEDEHLYEAPYKETSFESCIDNFIAVDESRRDGVAAARDSLRETFEQSAEQRDGAYWFYQPSRLNLLTRR